MIDVVKEKGQETLDPKLREILEPTDLDKEGYVYCARCAHAIAHVDDRIVVNGSHDHVFTNPHGYTHHLGCFRHAPGCAIHGRPEAADTWFPRFFWRLASCDGCGTHLGWSFERGENNFFGLILKNIRTDAQQ